MRESTSLEEMARTLPAKVEGILTREALLRAGDRIVVAVSGGPDSTALLHLLYGLSARYSWALGVAHVHHGFRGRESDAEAELVEEQARTLQLPFFRKDLNMPHIIEETGENAQAAAREHRYAFLAEVARRFGAARIALAHHADDQAETVLMRILRGTGPSGLRGMPIRRELVSGVELIRPLLRVTKQEIEAYCTIHGLPYAVDSSNLSPKYTRNRLRLETMPLLAEYNPQLPAAINRLAEAAEAEDDFMQERAAELFRQGVQAGECSGFSWSGSWFAGLHVALQRRLIKLILSYLASDRDSMDYLHIEQMRTFILAERPTNFRRNIAGNIVLIREYDRIAVHTMMLPSPPYVYEVQADQTELRIPETGMRLELFTDEGGLETLPDLGKYAASFDAEAIAFPLTLRTRMPGDRMQPFGLNGTKKVKDMFIDAKVSPSLREQIPVVIDARGRVLWVPGVRQASAGAITVQTRRRLHMKLHI